jgi:hypothetical protein
MREAAFEVTGRLLATVVFTMLGRDGGQGGARSNAWAAMAVDRQRARDRAEAAALLDSPHGPRREEFREVFREEGQLRRA